MSSPSDISKIRIPDAIQVNEVILDYLAARSAQRTAEIDKIIQASNRTDQLVIEVFKGLIARTKA